MPKLQVARTLRVISYAIVGAAIVWSLASSGGGCRGVGCLGNALVWLAAMSSFFTVATGVNVSSFFLQPGPRSRARKTELWVLFVAPSMVLLSILLLFVI